MAKFKLSLMMLLQYMMYAVWWVPLAAYLTNLEVSSTQKTLILSSMAIGCMASPLVGMLADRFWPAQNVLAGLNFVHAIMLLWAAVTHNQWKYGKWDRCGTDCLKNNDFLTVQNESRGVIIKT
jgi:MFS family permease